MLAGWGRSPRAALLVAVLFAMQVTSIHDVRAQAAEISNPAEVVARANNAFEYRDFQRVVDVLGPWVHPPRLTNPKQMRVARRLLGVSYHVLGRTAEAKEEFAQLLLMHPTERLDPFVVPPEVIDTFERVRAEMKDVLAKVLEERGQAPDVEAVENRTIEVPSKAVLYLPLGVPMFAIDRPGFGSLYLATQSIGLAMNLGGFLYADARKLPAGAADRAAGRGEQPDFERGRAIQYLGLALFAASWIASVVHAQALYPDYLQQVRGRTLR